ncbi:methyltransferase family protein [Tsukamurella paurometabola]|uniref:Isoprenylcysteine carboxyl methyltransferase n=1 Tax=Tsukamurella paurometabola TaxID=2061 RepID=A0A3P8L9Q0_TSUPA|nr:isoprenylcysteine carboxylmethyltransferase family protein [Tsukamurella paurometabola]UEA83871.1 isoprenylcysteine carboxylmethyltransferase family protein [Tsukamurella paurometabola]VDR41021.1 Putative protein-S-isoprenylcysteine methyltransferase [Tsukamurella paurometabola]
MIPVDLLVAVWLIVEVTVRALHWNRGRTVRVEWRSVALLCAAAAIAWVVSISTIAWLPQTTVPGSALIGEVIAAAGICLRVWAVHTLGRYFHIVVHVRDDHRVVRTGPYRRLAHPAYAGFLLIVFGLTLAARESNLATAVVVTAILAAVVVYRIRIEERALGEQLGDEYRAFVESRARVVPHVW